jgi:hypothetical protein
MAYLVMWVPQWIKVNGGFWVDEEMTKYVDSMEAWR